MSYYDCKSNTCKLCDPSIFQYISKPVIKDNDIAIINNNLFGMNKRGHNINDDDYPFVLIPVCFSGHWILVEWIKNRRDDDEVNNKLYIFNTLSGFNTESIQSTLKQYICSETGATEPRVNQIDILIQNGDWSCGYRIMVCINKLVTEQFFPYPQLLSFDDQTDVKSELENIFILDE